MDLIELIGVVGFAVTAVVWLVKIIVQRVVLKKIDSRFDEQLVRISSTLKKEEFKHNELHGRRLRAMDDIRGIAAAFVEATTDYRHKLYLARLTEDEMMGFYDLAKKGLDRIHKAVQQHSVDLPPDVRTALAEYQRAATIHLDNNYQVVSHGMTYRIPNLGGLSKDHREHIIERRMEVQDALSAGSIDLDKKWESVEEAFRKMLGSDQST